MIEKGAPVVGDGANVDSARVVCITRSREVLCGEDCGGKTVFGEGVENCRLVEGRGRVLLIEPSNRK